MTLLIVFVVMSVSISFLCSIMEAALLSLSPSYIVGLEEKNPSLFKKLFHYKENIDTSLGAILTLNTIAHTVGAIGVGAQVTIIWGDGYMGIASALMTGVILIFTEIFPKTIGAKFAKRLAPFTAFMLGIMIFILKPLLVFFDILTSPLKTKTDSVDVKDEIKVLARIGREEKTIPETDYKVINNILSLKEVNIEDVMTPKTVVQYVKSDMTIKEFDKFIATQPFSRYPIINQNNEEFLGYIHKSSSFQSDDNQTVKDFSNELLNVYTDDKLDKILAVMLENKKHIALVMDNQYGNWIGIVTLEDIIETILGEEIVDETDTVADMQLYAKMRWRKAFSSKKK